MKEYEIEANINLLYNRGIRFISGKWFNINTSEELNEPKSYIAKSCHLFKEQNVVDVMNSFILYYKEDTLWPELSIVKEARQLGPLDNTAKLPFDLDMKQLLIINRLLFHPEDEIMFITTGVGGSGKSTFLNIIIQLFDNDVSATTLDQLSNDFLLTEAVKHRLIASDELAKGELSMSKLKTLISKQKITVNPKHQSSYDVKTQSALFYCCNTPPRIDLTDSGILRRTVYYSRNKKISNPDKSLNKHVFTHDELLVIARRALAAEILNENDKWLKVFSVETHANLLKGNSVYVYHHEGNSGSSYEDYKSFCLSKGLKAYSEPNYNEINSLIKEWETEDAKYSKISHSIQRSVSEEI